MSAGRRGQLSGLTGIALALLGASLLAGCGAKDDDQERQTPSGFKVPRYVTLKFDSVNARAGPGEDRKELWTYHARGLPLQVVAETADWRRICDPDGALSWVHKPAIDGHRAVMALGTTPLALHDQPKVEARIVAYMAPRAIAGFDKCDKDWCRVRAGNTTGWAPAAAFWGVAKDPQCSKPQPVPATAPPPASPPIH
jgi:SH3-like domain-containing protein